MRIQVNDEKRMAVIWLTNADQADKEQQQELRSLYRKYSTKKYMVAVFRSGREDPAALTSHLICHNRICAAKAELRQAEREQKGQKTEQGEKSVWRSQNRHEMYQGPAMV